MEKQEPMEQQANELNEVIELLEDAVSNLEQVMKNE